MRKRTFLTSSIYSILQAVGGLLLHPYQTMQYLVEEKVFLWIAFAPALGAILFIGLWWTLLQVLFMYIPYIGLWAFTLIWAGCFFFFWQILLVYLLMRFLTSLR